MVVVTCVPRSWRCVRAGARQGQESRPAKQKPEKAGAGTGLRDGRKAGWAGARDPERARPPRVGPSLVGAGPWARDVLGGRDGPQEGEPWVWRAAHLPQVQLLPALGWRRPASPRPRAAGGFEPRWRWMKLWLPFS